MMIERQSAQQARRNKERLLAHRFDARRLSQRTRRNRGHELRQEQLSIARLSLLPQLTSTLSLRHRLSPCDVSCSFCGADHWIEERIQRSSKSMPRFSACCEDGSIMIAPFEELPQPLYSLLIESTSCMFSCHVTYLLTYMI